jgi:hypothetical protein
LAPEACSKCTILKNKWALSCNTALMARVKAFKVVLAAQRAHETYAYRYSFFVNFKTTKLVAALGM